MIICVYKSTSFSNLIARHVPPAPDCSSLLCKERYTISEHNVPQNGRLSEGQIYVHAKRCKRDLACVPRQRTRSSKSVERKCMTTWHCHDLLMQSVSDGKDIVVKLRGLQFLHERIQLLTRQTHIVQYNDLSR